MKRYYMVILLLVFMISCSTNVYNTPFINAEETVKLEFGLSKNEVLEILHEPLYVSNGDKNEVIWVYEVRTINVRSKSLPNGTIIPEKKAKTKSDESHANPIHKMSLTFINGKLISWNGM